MTSVLVTGAGGFLGRAVGRRFLQAGWTAVGLGSTRDHATRWHTFHRMTLPDPVLADVLRRHRPDVLVHCAGRASVPASLAEPGRDFDAGPLVLFDVCEHLRRSSPRTRLIFLSSAAVYGDPRSLPIDEAHEARPVSPYGFHKKMCELVCTEFARCYGLPTAVARIFSAYGPGLHRQVVWDTCTRAVQEAEVLLHGTGAETRDFIHVDDAAAAIHLMATRADCTGEAYNLASGVETSIADLAAEVVARVAPGKPIRFSGLGQPGMPLRWRANVARLRGIGFQPARDLHDGLGDTIAHHQREIAARCLKQSA